MFVSQLLHSELDRTPADTVASRHDQGSQGNEPLSTACLGVLRWYKTPGFFSQIWERSVRLFVDRGRLEEAQAIADRVLGSGRPEGDGSSSDQT